MMTFPTDETNETTKTFKACTLYFQGGYGISKIEAREVTITIAPYAQYAKAVHVVFVEKGKRRSRGFVQTYRPSLVVVEGHGHAAPRNFEAGESRNGVEVSRGRFSACSEGWAGVVSESIEGCTILADYREHNPY